MAKRSVGDKIRAEYLAALSPIYGEFTAEIESLCNASSTRNYRTNATDEYMSKMMLLLANGDPESSICINIPGDQQLISRLREGRLTPAQLVNMTEHEMHPSINMKHRSRVGRRMEVELEEKSTHMDICKNCHGNSTKQKKMQSRSGDEGTTLYITCQGCGFKWRQYS
jgi:DNA-directed RNA polymerase subunit M/transcription elongation factor TFIIS